MLFFDNEAGNIRDVSTLGVTSIFTPGGMRDDKYFLQVDITALEIFVISRSLLFSIFMVHDLLLKIGLQTHPISFFIENSIDFTAYYFLKLLNNFIEFRHIP